MKRGGLLRRKTRLKPVSAKRRAQADEYQKFRATVFMRHGWCQGPRKGLETPCGGPLDVHHIRPVGQYRGLRCDPDNGIVLCRAHHDHVHDYPVWARTIGLLV